MSINKDELDRFLVTRSACGPALTMRELTDLIRELLSWEVVEAALDKQAVAAEGRAET